jgi:hypothetical protein
MNQARCAVIAVLALALMASVSPAWARTKKMKVKAYNAQITYEFANKGTTPAHGLVVALSTEGVVSTDENTGAAGPFRNVRGNGTSKITLTNPTTPIGPAGSENSSLSLVFHSYKSSLKVKSWWWIDEKGKRIGDKNKG